MKPGVLTSTAFALTGIAIFALSGDILGFGFWGLVILSVAIFVGVSPHIQILLPVAKFLAVLAGILSLIAVPLGLLAATTGGSFRLPTEQAFLLLLFLLLALFGFFFARSKRPS